MAWQGALGAEILLRLDDANAEELGPQTIHSHARGEWIVAADQPLSQAETVGGSALWKGMKRGGHARLNLLAGIQEIAFVKNMRFAPFVGGQFAHHRQRHRLDVGQFLAQFL